jgi:hypothetical protein
VQPAGQGHEKNQRIQQAVCEARHSQRA